MKGASEPSIAGIRITHGDRVVYPDVGITKLELAEYYQTVAPWMLPHVIGRPLTLVFCPDGVTADCTYLKHGKTWGPKALRRVRIQEKTKIGEYMVADSVEGLVSLMQMNWIEAHTWNSTTEDIEHPNRLVFDLDPGPDVTWPRVIDAAREVREGLATVGLQSWVKTTGGRGLHVVAPVQPQHDWSECLAFARLFAETMASAQPSRYTTEFAKLGRERTILIDYLRNNRTNTSIAAFSPRARPGATVSVPLAWDELSASSKPSRWTVRNVPKRLAKLRADPWAGYWTSTQRLDAGAAPKRQRRRTSAKPMEGAAAASRARRP